MVIASKRAGDSGVRRKLLPGQWVRLTFSELQGALGTIVALRRRSRVLVRLQHGAYIEVGRQQVETVNRRW
jgi:hypothetical protein